MRYPRLAARPAALILAVAGCGDRPSFVTPDFVPASTVVPSSAPSEAPAPTPSEPPAPRTLPKPGNPSGKAKVPAAAAEEDTSKPNRVIGTGTQAGCTSDAVVKAVAAGGIITFDRGPEPVTITMTRTAKVKNTAGRTVVLDGGGRVTLGGGGGAIFVRGGRVKVVGARFTDNRCDRSGPDLGGAALRALSQSANQPVYVVRSTFTGGSCANGGALSSIGVSWQVLNSVFSGNRAIGRGANPARSGTPGGAI